MNRFYRNALATPVPAYGYRGEDANAGFAMVYRGLRRNQSSQDLYRSGIAGERIGAVDIGGGDIKSGIINFLIDVAHIMLIIGGLYVVAGAIWGGPVRR